MIFCLFRNLGIETVVIVSNIIKVTSGVSLLNSRNVKFSSIAVTDGSYSISMTSEDILTVMMRRVKR